MDRNLPSAQTVTGRAAFRNCCLPKATHYSATPTAELPIMDALSHHPQIEYAGLRKRSWWRWPIICAGVEPARRRHVHVAPGLGSAMGSLFNASSQLPVLVTAGQQEQDTA